MIHEHAPAMKAPMDELNIDDVVAWVKEQVCRHLSVSTDDAHLDEWCREAVTALWNAKVRTYIPILALRSVRDRLPSVGGE
jgi:hypothetical protein